jgi:L-lysine epsilon oxidase C-terminal domain
VFARARVGHENEIDLEHLRKSDFEELQRRAKHIFDQFRQPPDIPGRPGSGTGRMPYIWSDLFDMDAPADDLHPVNATLTRHQYAVMKAWSTGNFIRDWPAAKKIKRKITPDGLDRAALEACVGAAFFPGIESSFHIRDKFRYIEPFRLDHRTVEPGEVTQQMSLPWQTDFVDCSDGDLPLVWWPAQRPVDVQPGPGKDPVRWARNFRAGTQDVDPEGMVRNWWRLGLLKHTKKGVFEAHRVDRLPPRKHKKSRATPCPS